MHKDFMNKFAKVISYVSDGTFISIPIFLIVCLTTVDNKIEAINWAFLCLLFGIIVPYLYVWFLYKKKKISDVHIFERENRLKPMVVACISYIILFIILRVLKGPLFLKSIFAVIIVSTIILTIITYFWKICLHASGMTLMVITFNVLFGRWMLFMIPLILLIGWARIRIKKHTVSQVISGAGVTAVIAILIYYNYGFINLF